MPTPPLKILAQAVSSNTPQGFGETTTPVQPFQKAAKPTAFSVPSPGQQVEFTPLQSQQILSSLFGSTGVTSAPLTPVSRQQALQQPGATPPDVPANPALIPLLGMPRGATANPIESQMIVQTLLRLLLGGG